MARDADMDGWGQDDVDAAALMSDIVPQSRDLNPDERLALEDAHRTVVADPAGGIGELWVVCVPVFDAAKPRRIGNGVAVPDAL